MLSADEALEKLIEGNARFASGAPVRPVLSASDRAEQAMGQSPFAAILGCSDSRVPPEIVFDQPPGALFVVRVAGNVAGTSELGSLEFAVKALGVHLVMVLGHSGCGAVTAALDSMQGSDQEHPEHLEQLVRRIGSGLAARTVGGGASLDDAVSANVMHVVEQLRRPATVLGDAAGSDQLQVVGATYDLVNGRIQLLGS